MKPLLLALLLACPAPALAGAGGRAGEIFDIGMSGRGVGMGGAQTAVAEDVSALGYNPAGLGFLSGKQAGLMHSTLYGGASLDSAGYAHPTTRGAWGVQLLKLNAGSFEVRDSNNIQTGGGSYGETGLKWGYGAKVLAQGRLSLGGGVKVLSRSLGSYSNRLLGADFGLRYRPQLWDGRASLGFVGMNMVGFKMGDTDDKLETVLKAGAAAEFLPGMTLSFDIAGDKSFGFGAEYVMKRLALRAGFSDGGPSFGGGVRLTEGWRLDLAVRNSDMLGAATMFSVAYQFGKKKVVAARKLRYEDVRKQAEQAIEDRDYVSAMKLYETGLNFAAEGMSGADLRRLRRLQALVASAGFAENPEAYAGLKSKDEQGALGYKAVSAYLDDKPRSAILYASAAHGADTRREAFHLLLQELEKLTFQKADPAEISTMARILEGKMRKAEELFQGERYEEAQEQCQEALLLREDFALAHERMGSILYAIGRKDAAAKEWEKSLTLEPNNAPLKDFMRRLNGQQQ